MAKSDSLQNLTQNFLASPNSFSTAMDDIGAGLGTAIGSGGSRDRWEIGRWQARTGEARSERNGAERERGNWQAAMRLA